MSIAEGTTPFLSVIVPVYNEERTVVEVLRRLAAGPYPYPQKEVIVVDDGSTDATSGLLEGWATQPGFRVLRHEHNRGKGAAVRTALAHARGEIIVIQDADLEYDPADFPLLVESIRQGKHQAVYGSRYLRPRGPLPWTVFRIGVCFFNGLVRIMYGRRITDEATCYKAVRTQLLRDLDLQAERFELCAEITAKLCRLGVPIREVPISYTPRTARDGKKLTWRDGWQTAWTRSSGASRRCRIARRVPERVAGPPVVSPAGRRFRPAAGSGTGQTPVRLAGQPGQKLRQALGPSSSRSSRSCAGCSGRTSPFDHRELQCPAMTMLL